MRLKASRCEVHRRTSVCSIQNHQRRGSAFGMGFRCVALLVQGAIYANLRW